MGLASTSCKRQTTAEAYPKWNHLESKGPLDGAQQVLHLFFWGGLYLAQVNPYGIHEMNVGWDHSQFIVPWTSWIPYGMIMEWSWNGQFHMESTWIPWKQLEYIQAVLETIE